MASIDLFHLPVDMAKIFLLCFKILLRPFDNGGDKQHGNREDQKGNNCHQPADGKHHDQYADDRSNRGDNLDDALIHALAEGINIIGHAGEYLSMGFAVKIFHRHSVDFLGNCFSQLIGDLLGDAGHQKTLDIGK